MPTFNAAVTIAAPPSKVWAHLAKIGDIHQWNPGVVASRLTTETSQGIGAGRHCDLGGRNYLDETVVEWETERRLTMRIVGTNLPVKRADIRFGLHSAESGTLVTASPDYELKFGILGALVDRLVVRRRYRRGMEALLQGLKRHVEGEAMQLAARRSEET